jgi:hypothetical protein
VFLIAVTLVACAGDPRGVARITAPNTAARAIAPGPYIPGESYFGRNGYVEYIAGNAPVIFTAPHGGDLMPAEIPDRVAANCGGSATTVTDLRTEELVRAMQQRYLVRFGRYPHVVIVHLARRKLDANRDALEAACGSAEAEIAFGEWHEFIESAKAAVLALSGKGWYLDVHGHGHAIQRLELGYLLSATSLGLPDEVLDADPVFRQRSSIYTIAELDPLPFSQLLRGANSLGTLYADIGFPSIPSAYDREPDGAPYLSGGFNTRRHTCGVDGVVPGGNLCGVQIETNYTGVRDDAANRDRFGDATAVVLEQYLWQRWGLALADLPPASVPSAGPMQPTWSRPLVNAAIGSRAFVTP